MAIARTDPIVSGQLYPVQEVAGHEPTSVRDFLGESEFVIDWHGSRHRVAGRGVRGSADVLRFFETDTEHGGAEIRVWDITTHPGGGFVAYHLSDLPVVTNVIPQQKSR